jgi:phosphoserine phosphatase
MTLVATLICPPTFEIEDGTLMRARRLLPNAGGPVWLEPGIAADIPFTAESGNDNRLLADRLRDLLSPDPIDVVVQSIVHRRKRLFLADMDSTMIEQECIDEMADFAGLKATVAAVTERAMRGEISFVPALRERVAMLKGLPVTIVDEVLANRITLTPGGNALVNTMRKHGAYTCLVSGGFTLFTDRIAARIGFDETRANRLIVANDRFAGEVADPVFGRDAKKATLVELRTRLNLGHADTMAIGDGANDLDMIEDAGLGVAFHAKPAVAAAAAARIDHGDLSALLYAQGYARKDWTE